MKKAVAKEGWKKSGPAKDVDAYLAALPKDVRTALESLRKTIKAAAPKAVEGISYRIPAFKHHGMLVGFAAFPNHCSFILMNLPVMEEHKKELAPYGPTGSTIHFEASKPLPATLVRKLVKARIEQNEKRAKK
jgi:uncharacterized protein YdhG (YjbR/CyaY superfamily)